VRRLVDVKVSSVVRQTLKEVRLNGKNSKLRIKKKKEFEARCIAHGYRVDDCSVGIGINWIGKKDSVIRYSCAYSITRMDSTHSISGGALALRKVQSIRPSRLIS
jgi:hypothetical protein